MYQKKMSESHWQTLVEKCILKKPEKKKNYWRKITRTPKFNSNPVQKEDRKISSQKEHKERTFEKRLFTLGLGRPLVDLVRAILEAWGWKKPNFCKSKKAGFSFHLHFCTMGKQINSIKQCWTTKLKIKICCY